MHVKLNDVFFKTVDELTSPVKMLKVDAQNASAYPFRQTGMILCVNIKSGINFKTLKTLIEMKLLSEKVSCKLHFSSNVQRFIKIESYL